MNLENLQKAKKIESKLTNLKKDYESACYMTSSNIPERKSYLSYNSDDGLEVPESLFKVFGKLLTAEIKEQIESLEKELEEL